RVCHANTIVNRNPSALPAAVAAFERDVQGRVMIPAYARPAHRKLRAKLAELTEFSEQSDLNAVVEGAGTELGIIANGIAHMHAREAAPDARFLKLGMTYPLPMRKIREFAASVERCVVIEEGDPYLVEAIRAEGIAVEGKSEMYRFG